VEISISVRYSIGYGPDACIWVSGDAGWYLVQPHSTYATVFKDICDAITFYYEIMLQYEILGGHKASKSRKKVWAATPIGEIFFRVGSEFRMK